MAHRPVVELQHDPCETFREKRAEWDRVQTKPPPLLYIKVTIYDVPQRSSIPSIHHHNEYDMVLLLVGQRHSPWRK